MIIRWFFFISIIIALNWYSSLAIKTITKNPWIYYGYILLNFTILLNFIIQIIFKSFTTYFFYSLGLVLVSSAFQFSVIIFLFVEDFIRFPLWMYRIISNGSENALGYIPQRRLFVSQLSILLASIPAGALLIGMVRGKYNYKVIKHQLSFNMRLLMVWDEIKGPNNFIYLDMDITCMILSIFIIFKFVVTTS